MTPQIISEFKKDYAHLVQQGLIIVGLFRVFSDVNSSKINVSAAEEVEDENYSLESVKISVLHPFVFDHRLLPKVYQGVSVEAGILDSTIPDIFKPVFDEPVYFDEYWDPDKFVRFVETNLPHIRICLHKPDMSKEEALDAICFGDFQAHAEKCHEIKIKRLCNNS